MSDQPVPAWFASHIMGALTAAFPSWACAPMTVRVFYAALADCERADLERAVIAYIANETAWPTAAGVRKYARPQRAETSGLLASEAWHELLRNRHERRDNPRWSSDHVRRAAEAVQWSSRDWLVEQLPTIRAQFERYYVALSEKAESQALLQAASQLLVMSRERRGQIPSKPAFALKEPQV